MDLYRKCLCFWMLILSYVTVYSQHVPVITNFNHQHYQAHHQNWSVSQGNDKMMYFGNTEGLLTYNGNSWDLYKMSSKNIARSVLFHNDRVYTGTYGELGYWSADECKQLTYKSLSGLLKKGTIENEEIWHITSSGKYVFFQSFSVLLAYDGATFKKVDLPGSVMFLHVVGNKPYIQVLEDGIYHLDAQLKAFKVPGTDYFKDKIVTSILPGFDGEQSLLITTNNHGIFKYENTKTQPWINGYNAYFTEVQINKALKMTNGDIVIGTIRDGLLGFGKDGIQKFHISTANGLQNNTILSIKEDSDHNLWAGLDKGISLIHLKNNMYQFRDVKGWIGSVYTAALNDSILYIGTNQGVYFSDLKSRKNEFSIPEFNLVKGTQGQAWHLFQVKDGIFCGHNEGSYIIKKDKATKISNITGGWYNKLVRLGRDNFILQGNYTGLSIFKEVNGTFAFSHKIQGYNRPVKWFYIKGNKLWVSGPNEGLSRLSMDSAFINVVLEKKYLLPDVNKNHNNLDVHIFEDKLTIFNGEEFFYLDEPNDKLTPFVKLNMYNNGYKIRRITDKEWLKIYTNRAVSMFQHKEIKHLPYTFNQDYHAIANLQNGWNLYCLDDGYILEKHNLTQNLTNVKDTIIHCFITYNGQKCTPISQQILKIPYAPLNLKFHFFDFNFQEGKNYEYKLLPNENEWKTTENMGILPFSNLSYGNYRLQLKRHDGIIKTIDFEILPPWYLSSMAKIFYFILALGLLFLLNKYYEKKLKTEKQKYQLENDRLVREHQIQLENQRLISENLIKNKELANATLQLVQKNETLQDIKEELIEIRKTGDQTLTTKDFQLLMKQINENLTTNADKKLFNASFDDIHALFFKKLKTDHPELSADDLQLAAFLRMNLTSKDMAPLFNISIRGLENKRYRLRKKLKLSNEVDLGDYFSTYI